VEDKSSKQFKETIKNKEESLAQPPE